MSGPNTTHVCSAIFMASNLSIMPVVSFAKIELLSVSEISSSVVLIINFMKAICSV